MANPIGYIELPYPVSFDKRGNIIAVIGADGYVNFFERKGRTWIWEDGGAVINPRTRKPQNARPIVGKVKIFLNVKSIGISGGILTIVDAKNKTYQFS